MQSHSKIALRALAAAAVGAVAVAALRRALKALARRRADEEIDAALKAEPIKLRWDVPAKKVYALAEALERRSRAACDAIVAAHAVSRTPGAPPLTWDDVMGALDTDDAEFGVAESMLTFPGHVAADKVRSSAPSVVGPHRPLPPPCARLN